FRGSPLPFGTRTSGTGSPAAHSSSTSPGPNVRRRAGGGMTTVFNSALIGGLAGSLIGDLAESRTVFNSALIGGLAGSRAFARRRWSAKGRPVPTVVKSLEQWTHTGPTSGPSSRTSTRISHRGNEPPQSRQVMMDVLPAGSLLTHIRLCPILVSVNSEREESDGQDAEPHPREDRHEGAPCATRHDPAGVRGRAACRAYHGAQLGDQGKPAVRPRSAGAREAGRVLDRGPVRGYR